MNTKIAENGKPRDLLEGPADAAAWAIAVKLLDRTRAKKLAKIWQEAGNREEFEEMLRFRKVLHALVEAMRSGESVKAPTLNAINERLRTLNGYAEVLPSDEGFTKRFALEIHTPNQLLAPVAEQRPICCVTEIRPTSRNVKIHRAYSISTMVQKTTAGGGAA